jgi:hypothetical protein
MIKTDKIKKYLIIIPILVILFWASFALFHENFFIGKDGDFQYFYFAGIRVIQNPSTLYNGDHLYLNLPIFAYSFVIFTIFPYWEAHLVLWGLNTILGIIFVIELSRILKLLGIEKEITRMVFLFICVVNWTIYVNFYYPQIKIIVAVIVMFIIRREIEFRDKRKSKLYYFINYFLMIYSLSISPYYIFMWIIIVMDDIGKANLFKRECIIKIVSIIAIFLGQNIILFLFWIYPNLLGEYLNGGFSFFRLFYTDEIMDLQIFLSPFSIIFLLILIISNLGISFSNYDLGVKLGLSGVFYLLFNGYGTSVCFISASMVIFLFTIFLEEGDSIIDTLKNNKTHTLGLLILLIFNISTIYNTTIQEEFPFLFQPPLSLFFIYRLPILLCVMVVSLILLKLQIVRENRGEIT